MEFASGRRIEKYVVEKLLGRGGMASVWRVRHPGLGISFALKVVEVPGKSAADRLEREGREQGKVKHPNVVGVHDVIQVDGRPALVLEYVDGPALDSVLANHRMSLTQVDDVAKGILKGVRAAHRVGLVHRDLKPANVLMSRSDDTLVPKVSDFGLAKAVHGEASLSRTRTGMMMGTPQYMAPEQFRDAKNVDHRADIWSLGVMLFEISTGRLPYDGADLVELLDAMRAQKYPRAIELRPDLPDRITRTIERAMAMNIADRFDSVDEMYSSWVGRDDAESTSSFWDKSLLASFDDASQEPQPSIDETSAPPLPLAPIVAPSTQNSRTLMITTGVAGLGATAIVAGLAAFVVLVLGLGIAWVVSRPPDPGLTPEVTELVAPTPVSTPEPVGPAPVDVPPVKPADPAPTKPGPAKAAPAKPAAPKPAAPKPGPAKPAPIPEVPTGTVRVEGDAKVMLRSAGGTSTGVGKVPAGAYDFVGTFPGGQTSRGRITVKDGGSHVIHCVSTFGYTCQEKR